MARKRKARRQSHGSAWHWKQTDCWYFTMPGTKKRNPLFDEDGERIRGKENREAADLALAKEKLSWNGEGGTGADDDWLVARVCSQYLQYFERGLANNTICKGHRDNATSWLNDLCSYCGAMRVVELKKRHIQDWIDSHTTWRSADTHRSVISIVLAAFNRAEEMYDIPSPLKGLKKPTGKPRLQSINPEDEKTLYEATEPCFGNFLFAEIHTQITAGGDDRLEVVIDYRTPKRIDEQADEAKKLWDQGFLNKLIAEEMDLLPSYFTKILHHWHDVRGLPRPDNNRRRAELERKQVKTPTYKQIAAKVIELVDEGCSNLVIGRQLKVSDATVAKAITWWFASRGLPVPTAADRRLTMLVKARGMLDDGMLIKDIAADLGEAMPDVRSRRGNAASGETVNGHPDPDDEPQEDAA